MKSRAPVLVGAAVLAMLLIAIATSEINHRRKFGHFFGYGLDAELLETTADVGIASVRKSYAARLFNYTLLPVNILGVEFPGGYLGSGFRCRYQVQKWSTQQGQWETVADFNPTELSFPPARKTLYPLESLTPMAWEATGGREGLKRNDLVRFALFTSPAAQAPAAYTDPFRVE